MSAPVGPYSAFRRAGDWLTVSGQIGVVDGSLAPGGFAGELRQCLANLRSVLDDADASLDQVIKTNVYLRHMSDFAQLNEIWMTEFSDPRPARVAMGVAELPLGALVEVEAWAWLGT